MKKAIILILAILFVLSGVSFVYAQAAQTMQPAKTLAAATKAPSVFDKAQKPGTKATCPVLGNELTIDKNTPHSEYKGKHVYFCCSGCKPDFDKNPEKYLKKAKPVK
jgi:YHS domain-containing protein